MNVRGTSLYAWFAWLAALVPLASPALTQAGVSLSWGPSTIWTANIGPENSQVFARETQSGIEAEATPPYDPIAYIRRAFQIVSTSSSVTDATVELTWRLDSSVPFPGAQPGLAADVALHSDNTMYGADIFGHILRTGTTAEAGVNRFVLAVGREYYMHMNLAIGQQWAGDVLSGSASLEVPCWPIVIRQQPQSTTAPPGGSVTLSVAVDGTPPFHYQWLYLGTIPVGGDSSRLTIPNLNFSKLGSYFVTVLNCWGLPVWSYPAFVSMTVTNVPPNISQQPTDATVLQGQTARFNVGVYGQQPMGFWWTHNGIVIPGARQESLLLSNVSWTTAGAYQFFATNAYGFTNSHVATLTVLSNALPTVAVSGPASNSTVVIPADLPIQVSAIGGGGTALLGVELFVDGELVAAQSQPPYQFNYKATNAGLHTLTAVATDANGVQGVTSIPLSFALPPVNFAFEPNGSLTLGLTIPPGVRSVGVEASLDLQQWTTLTNVMTSGPSLNLNDPAAATARGRFYRLKYLLP